MEPKSLSASPVKFSVRFLRGNMIERASIGQLRKIARCLKHNAHRRATAFSWYVEDLDTTEKLKLTRGLAIQTLAIEVCEEELNRRRLTVRPWAARDGVLKILDSDWRRQARDETTSVPKEFSGADAHRARGMGVLLD